MAKGKLESVTIHDSTVVETSAEEVKSILREWRPSLSGTCDRCNTPVEVIPPSGVKETLVKCPTCDAYIQCEPTKIKLRFWQSWRPQ